MILILSLKVKRKMKIICLNKKHYYFSINIYLVYDEESVGREDFENLGFWFFWAKWILTYRI